MFDIWYIALIVVCLAMSGLAALMVRVRFSAAKKVTLASGMSGAEAAARIISSAGLEGVSIVEHAGFLSDHYNPMTRTLALSPDVYHGRHAAAVGVAAHEAGHALQHAQGYALMWMRSVLVPAANIGSMLGPWIVIIGLMLGTAGALAPGMAHTVAVAGVGLFGLATIFTLITVPVEFDASRRAKLLLVELGVTRRGPETDAVRSVLTAAGLTYVAAAAASVLSLLYWAWQAGLIGNRRD